MDEQVTIQNLQKQLAVQEAELHRVRNELTRAGEELVCVSDELTHLSEELAREVAEHRRTEETTRSLMLLLETLDAERVSPRVFRVVALSAPTDREKSQMYLQRYIPHLPAAGEVVLFDRSRYNRAGVERVMSFATEEQVETFLNYTPAVERAIIQSGVILIKYWLEVDMEEQAKRFGERNGDYRKIWKLSPMDLQAQARWYDYSRARDAMFAATDTPESPWYVVPSNDQRRARLNCITHFLSLVPYEEVPRTPIEFPKRQAKGDYQEPDYPFRYVPEKY